MAEDPLAPLLPARTVRLGLSAICLLAIIEDRFPDLGDQAAEMERLTEQMDDWRAVLFSIGFGQAPAGEEARAALARFPDLGEQ